MIAVGISRVAFRTLHVARCTLHVPVAVSGFRFPACIACCSCYLEVCASVGSQSRSKPHSALTPTATQVEPRLAPAPPSMQAPVPSEAANTNASAVNASDGASAADLVMVRSSNFKLRSRKRMLPQRAEGNEDLSKRANRSNRKQGKRGTRGKQLKRRGKNKQPRWMRRGR